MYTVGNNKVKNGNNFSNFFLPNLIDNNLFAKVFPLNHKKKYSCTQRHFNKFFLAHLTLHKF